MRARSRAEKVEDWDRVRNMLVPVCVLLCFFTMEEKPSGSVDAMAASFQWVSQCETSMCFSMTERMKEIDDREV